MARSKPLSGTLISRALAAAAAGTPLVPEPERERSGALDPQSMAEFLAYDIPFEVDPATGFVFPQEVDRG